MTSHRTTHVASSVAYAALAAITAGLMLSSADMSPQIDLRDSNQGESQQTDDRGGDRQAAPGNSPRPGDAQFSPAAVPKGPATPVCRIDVAGCVAFGLPIPENSAGLTNLARNEPGGSEDPAADTDAGVVSGDETAAGYAGEVDPALLFGEDTSAGTPDPTDPAQDPE
ncbi:MAG TPA: hypothetical protein VFD59_20215, partial [Nocardioidaceae bacterium]|nr:hypothetical protein [Nocardioidaceae bacterium]